ncbi:MAG: hypothetical protein J5669_04160 [Bacteroidales bacterium]|nr:hypothetical protein [Bacteroidales bacterium]
MKKIFSILGVAALLLTACNNKDNPSQPGGGNGSDINWDNVTVDGFYVAGPATGFDEINSKCVMVTGINEALDPKAPRDGMYEKYIVLEGGKEFYLLLNEAGNKTRYSAELSVFDTPADNEAYGDNPKQVNKGKLVKGNDAPAMKVAKTGLYHIVLDLNKTGDLDAAGGAQILLLDASAFGIRGDFTGSWAYKAMTPPANFTNDGMTFIWEDVEVLKDQKYKYNTGDYWKVTLDDAGKVKAETSLGAGLVPGASDIVTEQGGIMTIKLTFTLAEGAIKNSFKEEMIKTADLVLDPSTFVVGLSGGSLESGWGDPAGSCLAAFTSVNYTDQKTKAGTYVYDIASVNIPAGTMKIRYNGAWIGIGQCDVEGLEYEEGAEGADFNVTKAGQYAVKFTAVWDGEGVTSLKVVFTYTGELRLDPSTFKVGISGGMWKDGTTDWGWNDPFENDSVKTIADFVSKDLTDNATLAGTYVYEIASLPIDNEGGEFKLRYNGAWLKAELESTVTGLDVESTGGDDPSYKAAAGQGGNYKLTITAVWDGEKPTSVAGVFVKL